MATISSQQGAFSILAELPFAQSELGAISIPASAHSLDGFREWALSDEFPERARITFIDGELIIQMIPEYIETHNFIKTEITSVLHQRSKEDELGQVFSDGCLLSNTEVRISTEPDATFASHATLVARRCQVMPSTRAGVGEEIVGSPDWVLEIVSSSSVRKDKKLLRESYYRAGIREYWLVDGRGDDVSLEILVAGKDVYVAVEPQDNWFTSPTFGCSFRLTRQKNQHGSWRYTLHIQEKQ